SFEIFGEPLAFQYQFREDEQEISNTTNTRSSIVHQVQTLDPATPQETVKPVHSGIKSQYTYAKFVQGDNNHWAKAAAL
ncbi:chromosomal replication initiator protein DnaA, partial [Streptococcus suis]